MITIMKHNRIRTKKQRESRQMEKWTTRARKRRFLRLVRGIVDRSKGAPVAEVHAIYIGHKWGPEIIAREANRRLLQNDLRNMKVAGIKNDPAGHVRAMRKVIARTFLFEQGLVFKNLAESLVPAAASLSAMTKAYTTFRVQLEESGRLVKPENLGITELNPERARGQNIQYECVDSLHRTPDNHRYCFAMDPATLWHDDLAIEDMRRRVAEKMNRDIMDAMAGAAIAMEPCKTHIFKKPVEMEPGDEMQVRYFKNRAGTIDREVFINRENGKREKIDAEE